MADPVTILCSILTIADSSKNVLDVCKYYVSHAKNAPKELHRIIEDVNALEQTVRKLDRVAKSARRTAETSGQFDEWNVPLKRLEGHSKDLTKIIDRQDMKTGFFHELTFRARWPSAWREIRGLLSGISSEKQNIHLETTIYGL